MVQRHIAEDSVILSSNTTGVVSNGNDGAEFRMQALIGIKLLDQGLGVLQLFIHYLGGLAPLAFIIILSWLPDRGPIIRSRRVAGLAALSALFLVLTFGVGSMYVPGGV